MLKNINNKNVTGGGKGHMFSSYPIWSFQEQNKAIPATCPLSWGSSSSHSAAFRLNSELSLGKGQSSPALSLIRIAQEEC